MGGAAGQACPSNSPSATMSCRMTGFSGTCGTRLVVEKAMTKSPLDVEKRPPVRARPPPARTESRSNWRGSSGAAERRSRRMRRIPVFQLSPHWRAVNQQVLAPPEVAHHQHAYGEPARFHPLQGVGGAA